MFHPFNYCQSSKNFCRPTYLLFFQLLPSLPTTTVRQHLYFSFNYCQLSTNYYQPTYLSFNYCQSPFNYCQATYLSFFQLPSAFFQLLSAKLSFILSTTVSFITSTVGQLIFHSFNYRQSCDKYFQPTYFSIFQLLSEFQQLL